ncbi:MAG TPA: hypothetical protein VF322_10850 [Gammaproteobacteria bacterium]
MTSDDDFTDAFCAFLQSSITTVDAAELLLLLYAQPQKTWSARDLLEASAPGANLTETEVAKYVDVFQQQGLVSGGADGRVRYQPSPELHGHVQTLSRLYNERPVTLFRVIYALRDSKIKTLADAFRIWRK